MKIGRVLDLSSLSFEIFQTPICEIVELDMMRASTKQTLPKMFTVTVMT